MGASDQDPGPEAVGDTSAAGGTGGTGAPGTAAADVGTPASSTTAARRRWPGRRLVAVIVGVTLVIAATGTALAIATADHRPEPVVPPGAASGPGTPLPGGMAVLVGSVLLGPVVVNEVGADNQPTDWSAVVMVESDDPLAVWSGYVAQMVGDAPSSDPSDHDPEAAPGCRSAEDRSPGASGDALCELVVDRLRAELASVPGDVTGRFLLTLDGSPLWDGVNASAVPTWSGGAAPEPEPPRDRPDVGGPLAPETTAYEGDDERYVVLEGSELVAQHGDGSITGGFDVLLRVEPGSDIDEVTAAYVEQATQVEDEGGDPPEVVEHDGTTYTTHHPPGGAGGYSGEVTAVDSPGGDDYVVYSLAND